MKIIVFFDTGMKEFPDYKELFQELSSLGYIISSVEDGIIKASLEDKDVEISYGELIVESTKDKLLFDITEYKDNLKESISGLKKQGLIDANTLKKLGEQFAFLKIK